MTAADIAQYLGGQPSGDGYLIHCPVPTHGKGRGDRSASCLIKDGDKALLVRCFAGCDSTEVLDALRQHGGFDDRDQRDDRVVHHHPAVAEQRHRVDLARSIWREAMPATGTYIETYLRGRGITLPVPASIRFTASLRHGPTGLILPAMIGAVQSPEGPVSAIHRTFLRADGQVNTKAY